MADDEDDIFEITALDVAKVALVGNPASGFPHLIVKQIGDGEGDEVAKAALDAKARNALSDSDFAYVAPGGNEGDRHYPIHDEAHVRNALSRASAAIHGDDDEAKAIAEKAMPKINAAAKKFGIGQAAKSAISDGLPGAEAPDAILAGRGAHSGLGPNMNAACPTCGGRGYIDPKMPAMACPTCGGRGFIETVADSSLAPEVPLSVTKAGDAATDSPGSGPWESEDVERLKKIEALVREMTEREQAETRVAPATKAGRVLSEKSKSQIRTAMEHLSGLLGPETTEPEGSEEEDIMAQVTKEELAAEIGSAVEVGVAKGIEAALVAVAKTQAETTGPDKPRNARTEGHDVDADVEDEVDSHDSGGDQVGAAVKGAASQIADDKSKTGEAAEVNVLKAAFEQQSEVLKGLQEQMARFGALPREGGPVLNGRPPAFGAAAAQGVSGTVQGANVTGRIAELTKAVDEETNPQRRDVLGQELNYWRLRDAHESGVA